MNFMMDTHATEVTEIMIEVTQMFLQCNPLYKEKRLSLQLPLNIIAYNEWSEIYLINISQM